MPVPSQPPPSEKTPEKSGGSLYLLGAAALVGAAVALYFWKRPDPPPVTPQGTVVTATATTAEAPVAMFAPPPPPKLDDDADAGVDAGKAPVKSSSGGPVSPGPCAGTCTGSATGALSSALRGKAQSAQGCYNRALRTSEVSGSMTVSVQVGPSGQVCNASLANDSVHSGEIASCVLGRFRGQSFPPPSGGCVTVNIPISFTINNKEPHARACPSDSVVLLLAGAAATVAFAIGACADPDTQTPSCVDNVDQYGEHPATNGCDGFATCASGPPASCCMADAGVPLTGNDLATCLHGYGDPSCSYLISSISGTSGTSVTYTCSATAPVSPTGDAGSDGG